MAEKTLVLLGDSILDNAPYTSPEPDTTRHLQERLGRSWSVQLLAQDGATMHHVPSQLERLAGRPAAAVLSIGGNDALEHIGLLYSGRTGAAEVFEELLAIADSFAERYDAVAQAVAARVHRTILCTIYEVRLEPPLYARLARVPLAVLNDRIIRTGVRLGLEVLELRSVCTEASDFVMQIEPSPQGAAKIATAIAAVVEGEPPVTPGRVWSRCARVRGRE